MHIDIGLAQRLTGDGLELLTEARDGLMSLTAAKTDPHFAPLEGVQFHPESILSEHGHALLANFLKM